MYNLKKIATIGLITVKNYYLSTSKGVALFVLPISMIWIFVLQTKIRTESENSNLIINALLLVSCYVNINMLSSTIGYDIHFLRLKLYKASSVTYRQYISGVILPAILTTWLVQLSILLLGTLFFNYSLSSIRVGLLLGTSTISSILLIGIGVYIGFYSRNIVAAHTIANLSTSFLTFFGGIFFPIDNLPNDLLIQFAKRLPLYPLKQLYAHCFHQLVLTTDGPAYWETMFIVFLVALLSLSLMYSKNVWVNQFT
ncbi:hypothetical protein GCM10028805_41780 [Spirosoma harenae]